ncbi:MAG: ATP-dependent Clp protease adaptor ClpS [Lentisphaerae bacterium GWF2_44_16]|nr:MAG: ATP-dependent Clp protease adaptor ClpS [Lentisphaerae bacterium GWF2_44_16]
MGQTKHEVLEDVELKEPPMYKVILNNDDYTTMDFVVMVLMVIFHKDREEANKIMMAVHKQGRGLCGIYPYEVAETKIKQVDLIAEKHKFPLKCTMEEE